MGKKEKKMAAYMTTGEIAAKAGLTIRTVQYYDQKGLLSPSAKGSRNLRLYTEKDLNRLYQILCYKFLGLSLKEIRKKLEEEESPEGIAEMLHKGVMEEDERLSEHIRRYATLRNLEEYTLHNQINDWETYANLIEQFKVKWRLIWELSQAQEDSTRNQTVSSDNERMHALYSIAADALQLIRQGVSPESEEAFRLAERFSELNEARAVIHIDPDIMDIKAMNYSNIWKDLKEFMRAANKHYRETKTGK